MRASSQCEILIPLTLMLSFNNSLLSLYLSKGKHHTAVAKFKDALEHDFQQLEALFNISLQYQKMDKFEAQIKALELLKEVCLKFKNMFTSCVSLCQSRHNCMHWRVKCKNS